VGEEKGDKMGKKLPYPDLETFRTGLEARQKEKLENEGEKLAFKR